MFNTNRFNNRSMFTSTICISPFRMFTIYCEAYNPAIQIRSMAVLTGKFTNCVLNCIDSSTYETNLNSMTLCLILMLSQILVCWMNSVLIDSRRLADVFTSLMADGHVTTKWRRSSYWFWNRLLRWWWNMTATR